MRLLSLYENDLTITPSSTPCPAPQLIYPHPLTPLIFPLFSPRFSSSIHSSPLLPSPHPLLNTSVLSSSSLPSFPHTRLSALVFTSSFHSAHPSTLLYLFSLSQSLAVSSSYAQCSSSLLSVLTSTHLIQRHSFTSPSPSHHLLAFLSFLFSPLLSLPLLSLISLNLPSSINKNSASLIILQFPSLSTHPSSSFSIHPSFFLQSTLITLLSLSFTPHSSFFVSFYPLFSLQPHILWPLPLPASFPYPSPF